MSRTMLFIQLPFSLGNPAAQRILARDYLEMQSWKLFVLCADRWLDFPVSSWYKDGKESTQTLNMTWG